MSSLWNFTVGCSSPWWGYAPFNGGNATESWMPLCGNSGVRCDDGAAYTTGANLATLTLPFNGSAITIYGNVTATMSFQLAVDGIVQPNPAGLNAQQQILASSSQLPEGGHNISLQFFPAAVTDRVYFSHAVVSVDTGIPNVNATSIFIDDTASTITYPSAGNWTSVINFAGTTSPATINGNTFHQSAIPNQPAVINFTGSAVLIYGPCYAGTGANIATLPSDGILSNGWANGTWTRMGPSVFENCLRYFRAGLSPNISHTLTYANGEPSADGLAATLDYIEVISFSPGSTASSSNTTSSGNSTTPTASPASTSTSSSSTNVGAIVGGTIGGLVLAALITALIWLLWRRRRRSINSIVTPFDLAQAADTEEKPLPLPATGRPGYPAEKRPSMGALRITPVAGATSSTALSPSEPSETPSASSPPQPALNADGSPSLSAISNDVNRILAQLTTLGRRPAPEGPGQFANEDDGSVADWQTQLPQYDTPPH
ncbi:hypothetical protein CALCODRAFT_482673 [Calocera cornea HHB12733]|uniref:Uncharacterized protein n=1 Tax=Calocera cornea HHB12733 TaxID=1353952 RepID=A0A165GEG9_9BASI|nr:hypothetical protein CALCODRAFT_482673 [Calocera cornea HHB12733]